MFNEGLLRWLDSYASGSEYLKYESDIERQLRDAFEQVAIEKGLLQIGLIELHKRIVGSTRVDITLGEDVSLEIKFEPDYPGMPITRKPVTNVVLKIPDQDVARVVGLTPEEAQQRCYEIELDFLKLIAYKMTGIPHNYLLCLDEDGRICSTLSNSLRLDLIRNLEIPWKSIRRGKDGKNVSYFLWKA